MAEGIIKILVVDDDEDDIYLIQDTLDECPHGGYSVTVAHGPDQGAEIVRREHFDVVLCDYIMGRLTGVDFIAQMRADGLDTPIILLTGMGGNDADKQALAAGAADFVSKVNLTPELIDRSIRYALANTERQRLFQTVLDNVNAAVALINSDREPILWNPKFKGVAVERAGFEIDDSGIQAFAQAMLNEPRIVSVGNRVLEKSVTDTPNDGVVIILHDVTEHVDALKERERAENHAAHLARHCSLTNLPNRNALSERLSAEIVEASLSDGEFYLLILDLNKFKEVNDIYGHKKGDILLTEVARRLSSCCRDTDYIARLGGDEFIAIQRKKSGDVEFPLLAERILRQFDDAIEIEDILVRTGISIGVSVFPKHGSTVEELMSKADIAMYRAKNDPVRQVYIYDEAMDADVRMTMKIGQELRKIVERDDINVHFQPQWDLETQSIVGFEALARWFHPEIGTIPPSTFIPIAEDNGLIIELGEQALIRACKAAASWPQPFKVAVNISPVQFRHADLPALVHAVLLETGLPARRLELEITESVLIDDYNRALHALRRIKNLGVSIALDDFGTGFSSLSTLIACPFDKLKIDRSLVQQLGVNPQADVIMRAMIGMARELGFTVVAEGVETEQQLELLRAEQCQLIQGFLIGKPVSEAEVVDFVESGGFRMGAKVQETRGIAAA